MPINTDNAKMTLDFIYQWENEDGKSEQDMYIRYYISEEYGPTIAISTDQENYTGYPAEMFDEIVEFLNGQLGRQKKEQQPVVEHQPITPTPLPVPNIEKAQADIRPSNTTNAEPVQSFNTVQHSQIEDSQKNVINKQGTDKVSEEKIQAMWQSRKEEVAERAKDSQNNIRSKHKKQDEDE